MSSNMHDIIEQLLCVDKIICQNGQLDCEWIICYCVDDITASWPGQSLYTPRPLNNDWSATSVSNVAYSLGIKTEIYYRYLAKIVWPIFCIQGQSRTLDQYFWIACGLVLFPEGVECHFFIPEWFEVLTLQLNEKLDVIQKLKCDLRDVDTKYKEAIALSERYSGTIKQLQDEIQLTATLVSTVELSVIHLWFF